LKLSFPLIAVATAAVMMSSCSLTRKTADADSAAAETVAVEQPDTAATPLGKKGPNGANLYVDPLVSTKQHQAKSAPVASAQAPDPNADPGAFPPAPEPLSNSIAGLVTQPTGVRASSYSIFSSNASPFPSATTAPTVVPDGQTAVAAPAGGINAAQGSVFTPRQPLPDATQQAQL
jgi:hypothetical protein